MFVYDAGGKLVGEYSTLVPQSTPVTRYLTTDHLGSPRIITSSSGAVLSRRDLMPFGEEAFIGVGNRLVGHGYSYGDSTRQKFTGYERDEETNLDFAQARMHNYNHGRFTSPDPLMASAKRRIPQSWNRYSYVLNRPLLLIDPTGLKWGSKYVGNGKTLYCYVENGVCEGYTEVADGTILPNAEVNGKRVGTIILNGDGSWESFVRVGASVPSKGLSDDDASLIRNLTGGALCSLSSNLLCLQEGDSKVGKYTKAGVDAAQWVFVIKSLLASGLSYAAVAAFVKKQKAKGVTGQKLLLGRARDNLLARAKNLDLEASLMSCLGKIYAG